MIKDRFHQEMPCYIHSSDGISAVLCMNERPFYGTGKVTW